MGISVYSHRSELSETSPLPEPMRHRYRRHEPEKTAFCPIVEQHLSTFTDELTRHHVALPAFVVDEFRSYLRCGRLRCAQPLPRCDHMGH
jgi:hypothetical protein